jgi:hypothetical protein
MRTAPCAYPTWSAGYVVMASSLPRISNIISIRFAPLRSRKGSARHASSASRKRRTSCPKCKPPLRSSQGMYASRSNNWRWHHRANQSFAMHAHLIPSYYLDRVASTRTVPQGEPLRALAERLRTPLFESGGALGS